MVLFLFLAAYGNILIGAFLSYFKSGHVIIIAVFIAILAFSKKNNILYFCLAVFGYSIILILNINNNTQLTYNSDLFGLISEGTNIIYIYLICLGFYKIIKHIIVKNSIDIVKWVVGCGAIASCYSTAMATGVGSVSTISAFVTIPALFIVEDYKTLEKNNISSRNIKFLEYAFIIFLSVCMSQKLVCSYSWWGDEEDSYWEKTEISSIECLKGFKFSSNEIMRYDRLFEVIRDNTDSDSVIFSFPYSKVYNVFLDNYNMNTFAPVVFYDVCASDVAIEDSKRLEEKKPDIVIWLDIPGCIETHESLFAGGESLGQRYIQKWFSDVKDEYTLIGQVDNVFVYKLGNEKDVVSSYIRRKTATNETSNYQGKLDYDFEMYSEIPFEGNGTEDSPYLLKNSDDLILFRDIVNSGISFKGQFIRQTNDIGLYNIDNWEPIGLYGSNNLFEGTYNGDGYTISGLAIDYDGQNVGLFGELNGTVMNLGVVNCNISGDCVGAISSHGTNATIINCLVTGKINGTTRAGGIADNIGGRIINCVTNVEMSGKSVAGVSGYCSNSVVNCFSNLGNNVSYDDGFMLLSNTIDYLNAYIDACKKNEFEEKLNYWRLEGSTMVMEHKF